MEEETAVDNNFPLFSKKKNNKKPFQKPVQIDIPEEPKIHHHIDNEEGTTTLSSTFTQLGLSEWAIKTCYELGMKNPTPVQHHCIPKILEGQDVLGLAQTGSGKTAAFALPILNKLAQNPYGVFALVVTPTRELAYQLAEQFRALGSSLHVRVAVVVGGMDMITQLKALTQKPHVVISTPGRIKVLLEENHDIPAIFSKTKFLVLDEADRVLDVGFEDELRVIFQCLPKQRQTLLFSATMTSNLKMLLEVSANKAFFYAAYEGVKFVESLEQQYLFVPKNVKDVYLLHIISKMEDMNVRSVIIFASRGRTCRLLRLLLEELDKEAVELHSLESQSSRLAALNRFKSRQVPCLIATDVASRGLDIPTVDLVINYDLPRDPSEYVHRVGRTARAGREGLAVSFVTENDVELVHKIEEELGKKLEEFKCKEKEVLADITKVFKARRVARMQMLDDGFEDIVKERKKQNLKTSKDRKRKRNQQVKE
ncbi:DEAD-box ATP-dependent RNA helicase 36 [Silene latifolia]|uniref:DEAD-box ATP-dependent RNA helicase 36 n=1 Tax=Silene latifolia TaxID=37657 RepID=UPI003D78A1F0